MSGSRPRLVLNDNHGPVALSALRCLACGAVACPDAVPNADAARILEVGPGGAIRAWCSPRCAAPHGWPWLGGGNR